MPHDNASLFKKFKDQQKDARLKDLTSTTSLKPISYAKSDELNAVKDSIQKTMEYLNEKIEQVKPGNKINLALPTQKSLSIPVAVDEGGTGATTAAQARTNLGVSSGGTPGGSDTQVQYNNVGAFGGITGATTNGTALTLVAPVLGTPASGTLTNCTALPVSGITSSTSTALGVGSLEIGHASDTTLARVSAGVASIEGVNILTVAGGTLTGNITLGENTSIALDPAGSADGKYSGITVTGTAGATLAFGDLIVLDVTDSRWELADANSAAAADGDSRGLIGMCVLAAAGDGSATTILLNGIIRADAAFPALTVAAPVYVSETAGDIVVAQPTTTDVVIRVMGFALTADEIYFNPSPDYITHT